jgi:hypothetical protein
VAVEFFFPATLVAWAIVILVLLVFFFLQLSFSGLVVGIFFCNCHGLGCRNSSVVGFFSTPVTFWFGLLQFWCCWEVLLDHPVPVNVVISLFCQFFFFVVIMSGKNSIILFYGKNYASWEF